MAGNSECELPKTDLMKEPVFVTFDVDGYYEAKRDKQVKGERNKSLNRTEKGRKAMNGCRKNTDHRG